MYNKFQLFLEKQASTLATHWNKITGKTNFSLAKIFLFLGGGIIVVSILVRAVLYSAENNYLSATVFYFLAAFYCYKVWQFFKVINALEDAAENMTADGKSTLKISPITLRIVLSDAPFYICLGIFFRIISLVTLNPISIIIFDIPIIMFGFSLYIAMRYRAGGKSVVARAKDLIPSPAPQPVAVRI